MCCHGGWLMPAIPGGGNPLVNYDEMKLKEPGAG